MTEYDQIYPPKSMLCMRVLCVLIKRPHTSECASVCRFSGAPTALDAYISPYQRTLIAPSMSEQIHAHTSIHKASLTHMPSISSLSSSIIHKNVAVPMGPTQTHVHSHVYLYIALVDINDFSLAKECTLMACTFAFRRYTYKLTKLFPEGLSHTCQYNRGTAWILDYHIVTLKRIELP